MILELINIHKEYKNNDLVIHKVLDNLSLSISSTDSIAITGPSGSGKTTLLNIMGSLDKASSGIVKINEVEIQTLKDKELSLYRNLHIGFVFQLHYLLPQLTILENVILPVLANSTKEKINQAKNRALKLFSKIGLSKLADRFPQQLSVGECQRAAVVRALINEPSLILADEPTGSLDNKNAMQLINLLLELKKERNFALIVVTHSLEIANLMDKHYFMSNGSLVLN